VRLSEEEGALKSCGACWLQAADLLGAKIHLQELCSTLAARLFASRRPDECNQQCQAQVLLCTPDVPGFLFLCKHEPCTNTLYYVYKLCHILNDSSWLNACTM
jgi:hypothetical protein